MVPQEDQVVDLVASFDGKLGKFRDLKIFQENYEKNLRNFERLGKHYLGCIRDIMNFPSISSERPLVKRTFDAVIFNFSSACQVSS